MEMYCYYQDAIDDLIQRGYINDFVLFGDDLLWVQQKIFIPGNDFCILEYYSLAHPNHNLEDLVVFGISAFTASIKGLLFNHYSYSKVSPGIIITKIHSTQQVNHLKHLK